MGTIALCSKDLEFRQFMAIMNVDGYKKWFENLGGGEVKNFTKCFDNSVKHSLRMFVCCEEVSEEIMNSIFNLICSEENEHDYNFKCKILYFITRPENKKNLFQIIEMSRPENKKNLFQIIEMSRPEIIEMSRPENKKNLFQIIEMSKNLS